MASEMVAREARPGDISAIADLWKRFMAEEDEAVPEANPEAALPGWLERLQAQIAKATAFVLEAEGEIVGFASFIGSADRQWVPSGVAYAVDLYIQPEYRKAGAARKLFALLMDQAAAAGYGEVWTNTDVRNQRVQVLLERAGFTPNPGFEIPGLQGQLYLRKSLPAD